MRLSSRIRSVQLFIRCVMYNIYSHNTRHYRITMKAFNDTNRKNTRTSIFSLTSWRFILSPKLTSLVFPFIRDCIIISKGKLFRKVCVQYRWLDTAEFWGICNERTRNRLVKQFVQRDSSADSDFHLITIFLNKWNCTPFEMVRPREKETATFPIAKCLTG